MRLAIVVSHPIQYFVPLYQRMAEQNEIEIRVFYTWHGGSEAVRDRGFGRSFAWDIPLTRGYEFEVVPNTARDPGTHHFRGLQNPSLVARVMAWKPDIVHLTGWAWESHLLAMRTFHRRGVPVLFRGDSHLLDGRAVGPRWWAKKALLERIYRWPAAFLVTGKANRAYYEEFGVPDERLFDCPHTIDVSRFAEPAEEYERAAAQWRRELGISPEAVVVLFAGKFEPKKQPLELMRAIITSTRRNIVGVMAGDGVLQSQVESLAREFPERFRTIPFQNQSKMPIVYRLGDLFVLPSAYQETWGLAVNEALACGRPVLVSNRVGCAQDVVLPECGTVYESTDLRSLSLALDSLCTSRHELVACRRTARERSWNYDTTIGVEKITACVRTKPG